MNCHSLSNSHLSQLIQTATNNGEKCYHKKSRRATDKRGSVAIAQRHR